MSQTVATTIGLKYLIRYDVWATLLGASSDCSSDFSTNDQMSITQGGSPNVHVCPHPDRSAEWHTVQEIFEAKRPQSHSGARAAGPATSMRSPSERCSRTWCSTSRVRSTSAVLETAATASTVLRVLVLLAGGGGEWRQGRICPDQRTHLRSVGSSETVQEHVYNTTVSATCLPHTGFAGVWTPATYAELICHRTIHKHGSKRTSGFDSPHRATP